MGFHINTANEQKILSYIMKDVTRIVEVEDFFLSDMSKNIYFSLDLIYKKGLTNSIDMLKNQLHRLDRAVPRDQLALIRDSFDDYSDIYNAIDILKEDFVRHKIGTEMLEDVYNKYMTHTDVGMEELMQAVLKINNEAERVLQKEKELYSSSELARVTLETIKIRAETKDYIKTTGCKMLDNIMSYPFHPKQITTVFGQKGSGKSSFVQYLANRLIYLCTPLLYVSLELDKEVIMDRFLSMRTGIPMMRIVKNLLTDEEREAVESARALFDANNNFFFSDIETNIAGLERKIRDVQKRTGTKYMVMLVDLGTMVEEFGQDMEAKSIESAMNKLHALAGRTGIHIVFVVQENENRLRGAQKITKQNIRYLKPKLSDIKGGSSIAERSRVVLYVWNQTYMEKVFANQTIPDRSGENEPNPEMEIKQPDGSLLLDVSVMKQNLGKVGSEIQYSYFPEICKLMPYIG